MNKAAWWDIFQSLTHINLQPLSAKKTNKQSHNTLLAHSLLKSLQIPANWSCRWLELIRPDTTALLNWKLIKLVEKLKGSH